MKICYFSSGIAYNKASGPSAHIVNIARALNNKNNVEVDLLFNSFSMSVPNVNFKLLSLEGMQETEVIIDPLERSDDVSIRGLNPLKYLIYILNCYRFYKKKRGRYDVFIERMWRLGGLTGLLLKKCSKARRPLFILEENGPMKFDRKLNTPGNLIRLLLHKIQRGYTKHVYKKADAIVVQTTLLKDFLWHNFGLDRDKIFVIPNGVDTEHFSPADTTSAKEAVNFTTSKRVFLYVGSIDAFHDLSRLLEAFALAAEKDAVFIIIGDGVKRGDLVTAIKESELQNVIYHGPVSYDVLPNYINAADICVAPYSIDDFEGKSFVFSPLKILEYMACGKPVVSQPLGQISELVDNRVGGFLVSNSADEYLSVINAVSTADPIVLEAMGRYNREKTQGYKWSAQADKYIKIIENMT